MFSLRVLAQCHHSAVYNHVLVNVDFMLLYLLTNSMLFVLSSDSYNYADLGKSLYLCMCVCIMIHCLQVAKMPEERQSRLTRVTEYRQLHQKAHKNSQHNRDKAISLYHGKYLACCVGGNVYSIRHKFMYSFLKLSPVL